MLSELTGPERAALTPSAMVGALLMSRAINDEQLSPGAAQYRGGRTGAAVKVTTHARTLASPYAITLITGTCLTCLSLRQGRYLQECVAAEDKGHAFEAVLEAGGQHGLAARHPAKATPST